jgi:hypothetical protein
LTKEALRVQTELRTYQQETERLGAQVQRLTFTRQRHELLEQLPALEKVSAHKGGLSHRTGDASTPGVQLMALFRQLEMEPLMPKAGAILQKVIRETQVWTVCS